MSSHIMFIRFSIQNCVFKSRKSWNKCWFQATSCLSSLQSKIVSWNQQNPEISAGIKSHHVYLFYNQKLCLQINKFLKLVLLSSHVMFIRFSIQNCVFKLRKSSNKCRNQAISCLSCSTSKNMSWNQQSPQISGGIKLHLFYQVQHQKLCLEISKVLK